jgi:hypothetical protein
MPILFTPGQMMSALVLSKQQWRTYRQALAPLNVERGRSACFTAGDLLATAVVQSVANTLQMPLSGFSAMADGLFSVCSNYPWPRLERSCLLLAIDESRVMLLDHEYSPPLCPLAIVVHLQPLVGSLRETLVVAANDPQHDLAFPRMVAGGRP